MCTSARPAAVPVSFELFPPRDDAAALALGRTIDRLAVVGPEFFAVTFGAGGSIGGRSLTVLRYILGQTQVPAMAHLTCVGSSVAGANALVREFLDAGVTSFLALRGDAPQTGGTGIGDLGSAAELAQLILRVQQERQPYGERALVPGRAATEVIERPRPVRIAVAAYPSGHPRSRSRWQDIDALAAKEAAGATMALTQVLFEPDDYLEYCARARDAGVSIPIVPGIMPADSPARLARIAELSDQTPPPALAAALAAAETRTAAREVGIEHVVQLATTILAAGAPGLHLYSFNRHDSVLPIIDRLIGRGALAPSPTRTITEASA